MEEEKNDAVVEEAEEETPEAELTPETDWEAEAKKARGIAQRLRTKLTKATEKKVDKVEPTAEPVKEVQTTGELDETQLEILELRGFTEDEDIKYVESYMKRNGLTLRQVLKDDIAVEKLASFKAKREVKAATPSSTKRSGGGESTDLALATAKYEQSGVLPEDFALRSAVINAKIQKENTNKPAWH